MDRWGLWTRTSLEAAGIPASTARDRVRRGTWERVLPGVVATRPLDGRGLCRAVTLWRPDAVLSHRTAAWLWGFLPEPDVVEATVPRRISVRPPEWVLLHRRDLPGSDVSTAWGLPVVAVERAVLDCHAVLSGDDVDRLVDTTFGREVNPWVIGRRLTDGPPRWGAAAARQQLLHWPGLVDSEPERLLGRTLRRRGWRFESGVRVGRHRVDFLHRPTRTVVEVDGRRFHSEPAAFVSDRWRQNEIQRGGLMVLRYAATSVFDDVDGVADDVIATVRQRPRRPWPSL